MTVSKLLRRHATAQAVLARDGTHTVRLVPFPHWPACLPGWACTPGDDGPTVTVDERNLIALYGDWNVHSYTR